MIQNEDKYFSDIGRFIQGKPLLFSGDWHRQATIGQGVQSPRQTGSSANWYQLAASLCCATAYEPGIKSIPYVLSAPNDWKQGEYAVDPRHDLFHLIAFMGQRKWLRKICRNDLADAVHAEIRQWWAAAVCSCDQIKDPRRTKFA